MKKNFPYYFIWMLISASFLLIISCQKEEVECPDAVQRSFPVDAFSKVRAGETFFVTVEKGTSYSLTGSGCTYDLNDLDLKVVNQELKIGFKYFKRDRHKVTLHITLPVLTAFNFHGTASAKVSGFLPLIRLRGVASGNAVCVLDASATDIFMDVSGQATVAVNGNANTFSANVADQASVNAYNLAVNDADMAASGQASIKVAPSKTLLAYATGQSRIFYRGNAFTKINVEGSGKVIKE